MKETVLSATSVTSSAVGMLMLNKKLFLDHPISMDNFAVDKLLQNVLQTHVNPTSRDSKNRWSDYVAFNSGFLAALLFTFFSVGASPLRLRHGSSSFCSGIKVCFLQKLLHCFRKCAQFDPRMFNANSSGYALVEVSIALTEP